MTCTGVLFIHILFYAWTWVFRPVDCNKRPSSICCSHNPYSFVPGFFFFNPKVTTLQSLQSRPGQLCRLPEEKRSRSSLKLHFWIIQQKLERQICSGGLQSLCVCMCIYRRASPSKRDSSFVSFCIGSLCTPSRLGFDLRWWCIAPPLKGRPEAPGAENQSIPWMSPNPEGAVQFQQVWDEGSSRWGAGSGQWGPGLRIYGQEERWMCNLRCVLCHWDCPPSM